eukprot:385787_1
MGCLFYNSPSVQYRWCLAGVSPAPCPFNRTVLHALNLILHWFPWTNIHSNGTMHYIIGSDLPILFLPPIASDCHLHIQYASQRTLEQVDSIILFALDSTDKCGWSQAEELKPMKKPNINNHQHHHLHHII